MLFFPFFLISFLFVKKRYLIQGVLATLAVICFIFFGFIQPPNPNFSKELYTKKKAAITKNTLEQNKKHRPNYPFPSWDFNLQYMSEYKKLNTVLDYVLKKQQYHKLQNLVQY